MKKAQRKVKVKRALGDGSYDTHSNFKFLAKEIELEVWVYHLMLSLTVAPASVLSAAKG